MSRGVAKQYPIETLDFVPAPGHAGDASISRPGDIFHKSMLAVNVDQTCNAANRKYGRLARAVLYTMAAGFVATTAYFGVQAASDGLERVRISSEIVGASTPPHTAERAKRVKQLSEIRNSLVPGMVLNILLATGSLGFASGMIYLAADRMDAQWVLNEEGGLLL